MSAREELMTALNEYASELELDISELKCSNAVLITAIDIILEQDECFYNYFYTNR